MSAPGGKDEDKGPVLKVEKNIVKNVSGSPFLIPLEI